MNLKIERAMRAGRGYWFVDGFTEMIAGGLFILLSGALLLRGLAAKDSFLAQFGAMLGDVSLIKIFGLLLGGLLIWWLKDRFTYPRTGFVREKRPTTVQILQFLRNEVLCLLLPVLGFVAAVLLVPFLRGVLVVMPAWLPIFISFFMAGACFLAGRWMGLRRFEIMGILILLVGIGSGFWQLAMGFPDISREMLRFSLLSPMPEGLRAPLEQIVSRTFVTLGWMILGSGVILILSGLVTFWRYRKENPVPYEGEA